MEIQDDGYVVYTKREYAAGICFAIPFFLLLPLKLLLAWLNSRNLSIFLFGCGYGGVLCRRTGLVGFYHSRGGRRGCSQRCDYPD